MVHLSAYRIISIPSYFLRMGRKGLGESQTMVSCRMGNNRLVTLLLSVRIPIHLGRLCVELVQYALLFCRIQWILAIRTLSAQPRLVVGQDTVSLYPHVSDRLHGHFLRFPPHDRIATMH